jgi:hypothetical protein
MKHRALDLFLLIVVFIGGALSWQTGRERSRLSEKHARLARSTGEFRISDPSKVHVQALETGDPMHFAWRVYHPGKVAYWPNNPSEVVGRLVFRHDEQGILRVFYNFSDGGTSVQNVGDKALAELLRDRWDRVRFEQLGARDLAVLDPNQPLILLRLTLPDDLEAEARRKLPPDTVRQYVPILYELNRGPMPSKP